MSDLLARFLPRFAALTRERTAKALAIAAAADTTQAVSVVRDMHSVAGEAGMLGLEPVLLAARQAEIVAKRMGSDPAQADALTSAVRALEAAIEDATRGMP